MANQHGDSFERWLGPPLPTFQRRPDGVQESRQSRRQSQQILDQHVRQSQQISNHTVDCALHPSSPVSNNEACSSSAQQIPRSSQQISAGFPPLQQRSAGSNSNSISKYIELSPARRREIIIRVTEFVQNVMASMLSDKASNVQWKPKFRKKDISYYVDETSVKPGQTRFCCNTCRQSPSPISTALANYRATMYVQYTSCRSPGLMVDREVCIAVATDMIHQPDGSTIGYCLWETVDGPEFAKATNKFESSIMFRSGFFFRRSGRQRQSTTGYANQSYTKIVYMVGLEPDGWAPGLATKMLMEKFGTTVTRLCSHFRRKQLDSRMFVMKTEWTSKISPKSCKQCEAAPSAVEPRKLPLLRSRGVQILFPKSW
ncbi:unnamed protein product [Peronospora destructor]|uniref:Uncharacterized protein n=1 Tax=Peronospora destructor TaxID=86335 RepID=A0AAV0T3A3_9STRA|nr:unnamed protein product [Peronospora destructor]